MLQTAYTLPNVVPSGMFRKISDALQARADGHPATNGRPGGGGGGGYYNYYISEDNISFDTFLTLLSVAVSKKFPEVDFSLDWVRQCDRSCTIFAARNAVARLRAHVRGRQYFRTSFWDTLWNLTEVSLKNFSLTHAEIRTSRQELDILCWRYLLIECEARVKTLQSLAQRPKTAAARKAFSIVDDMLTGNPIAGDDFCGGSHTCYSSPFAYSAYGHYATGRTIRLEDVGWSVAEYRSLRAQIFPDGYPEEELVTSVSEPTAPATADADELVLTHEPSFQPPMAARASLTEANKDPLTSSLLTFLSELIESTLPPPPAQAISVR